MGEDAQARVGKDGVSQDREAVMAQVGVGKTHATAQGGTRRRARSASEPQCTSLSKPYSAHLGREAQRRKPRRKADPSTQVAARLTKLAIYLGDNHTNTTCRQSTR